MATIKITQAKLPPAPKPVPVAPPVVEAPEDMDEPAEEINGLAPRGPKSDVPATSRTGTAIASAISRVQLAISRLAALPKAEDEDLDLAGVLAETRQALAKLESARDVFAYILHAGYTAQKFDRGTAAKGKMGVGTAVRLQAKVAVTYADFLGDVIHNLEIKEVTSRGHFAVGVRGEDRVVGVFKPGNVVRAR